MFRWVMVGVLVLAGCAATERAPSPQIEPMDYDPAAVAAADTLVVMVPGALTSRGMFAPAERWAARPGYALAFYRYPGMNGLPVDRHLDIAGAGREIAAFANRYPGKRIRLMGYSTGGPIVILAAQQIGGDVRVAALSSAVEHAGGASTALRVAFDVLDAAARAGSLKRETVWLEYYRTLLFGRDVLKTPEVKQTSDVYVERLEQRITLPEPAVPAAQSGDLRRWELPEDIEPQPERIRFFVGREDRVFSNRQTLAFARELGGPTIHSYPGHGHLIYLTHPQVFDDVLAWFEAP